MWDGRDDDKQDKPLPSWFWPAVVVFCLAVVIALDLTVGL